MAKSQTEVLASLEPALKVVFAQLVSDYNAAKAIHVPNYLGGPSFAILGELVRQGWRKAN